MGRYGPLGFGQRLCSSSFTFGFFSKVGLAGSFTVCGSSGAATREGRFCFSATFFVLCSIYHKGIEMTGQIRIEELNILEVDVTLREGKIA
jgi:hypothetical protein